MCENEWDVHLICYDVCEKSRNVMMPSIITSRAVVWAKLDDIQPKTNTSMLDGNPFTRKRYEDKTVF